MSGCIDKRFENMLHAYELNLLEKNEQFEFEVHLYNCSSCFEKVSKFKQTADLLEHSPKIRDTIEEISKTNSSNYKKTTTHKKVWPTIIPISIAAIFFVFLILKDWQIDIHPSKEATAASNRLAVMYFDNLTDQSDSLKLGEIVANLLISDLSESQYLNIISSQHLSDILGLLNKEGIKNINNTTASQIAKKTSAKWIITGNILSTSPQIIVTTQLIEVGTGDVLASKKIEGESNDDIFSVIDKLTIQIKNSLNLPSEALLEPDPEIAEYTTHSPQAYRHYLEGIENYNRLYSTDAQNDFEMALKYDSTFAMAYYYLAHIKDRNLISKALEYSDGASTIDRLFINIFEASRSENRKLYEKLLNDAINQYPDEKKPYYLLAVLKNGMANYHEAIDNCNIAINIDPQFKMAYNLLAYAYDANGDFEKALWAIDKYIELAPNEANPLDTKAEIYAANGMLDNAIESYKRALNIKPDFLASAYALSLMYMFEKEYDKADSCIDMMILAEDTSYRETAGILKFYIPQFQGKFDDAIKAIDIFINNYDNNPFHYYFLKSLIYIEQKHWILALDEIEKTIELHDADWPEDKMSYRFFHIHVLAQKGDIKRANKLAEELRIHLEQTKADNYSYLYAVATIANVRGKYEKAISSYKESKNHQNQFFTGYMLANVYLKAGKPEEAIGELEQLSNSFGHNRAYYTIWSTKLHYHLGIAYEQTGQHNKAIDQFTLFLDIWKEADGDIKEIDDARNRLVRLQSQS
ncbi:MAG: tetratricopeptide repeat protein [candidate division Zixibacteria bacterium]|nr:tetratricopeptide repeat protein [candidate division Zixibacteria bacterium]